MASKTIFVYVIEFQLLQPIFLVYPVVECMSYCIKQFRPS